MIKFEDGGKMNLDISQLRYVLFDWDNTLAETRTALVTVINEVLEEYQMPGWDEVKKRRDEDLSFRDNFPNIFGDKAEAAYHRYRELYKSQIESLISTFSCVQKTLDFFSRQHIPMIIMTNKDRLLLDLELPFLFNPSIFAKIVAGHEAPKDKPSPEHAYYSLQGYLKPEEITPQNVWIIGDSSQDSDCAIAANAQAIRIGKPIWNDDHKIDERILYFDSFCKLLESLQATI